ncbi:MAG: sugar phosphate isomerase/epimerase family protein [Peptostreptococcaceae bacterium]
MKIGISSLSFNLNESLEICKNESMIEHIEIGIDNIEECKKLLEYEKQIKDLNLSVSIHLPMELNPCENINYIRESWTRFINIIYKELKKLDIKYFNLHLGYVMTNRLINNRNKYLENVIKFLDDSKLDENIILSIENTYSKYGDLTNVGNKSKDFEYIFERVKNKKIWFCYDTGHFLIDEDDYIENLESKLKIVHLSDNDGYEDNHIGIGKGILDKNHISKILNMKINYLILEINHMDIQGTLVNLKRL